jgi:hypothetical protein
VNARIAAACLAGHLACVPALAAGDAIAAFSGAGAGGPLPAGWSPLTLPRIAAPEFALVADSGVTVLRVRAASAAGTVAHSLDATTARTPILSWRWRVDRVVEGADLERKSGDDFAARVYVFFDVPADSLPLAARMKAALARAFWGEKLPTAAICYVWDNRHPVGTSAWNPYTDRVRTVVLRSGSPGAWAVESRDLEADFRAAFGGEWQGPVPRVTGIAAGNDTDQTRETVTAWFGDFRLEARR